MAYTIKTVDGIFDGFEGFDWDTGNRDKNFVKHRVRNVECEQIFFNEPLIIVDDTNHSLIEKRWAAFGKTDSSRLLVVIFTARSRLLRVISARDMNHKERTYYEDNQSNDTGI